MTYQCTGIMIYIIVCTYTKSLYILRGILLGDASTYTLFSTHTQAQAHLDRGGDVLVVLSYPADAAGYGRHVTLERWVVSLPVVLLPGGLQVLHVLV